METYISSSRERKYDAKNKGRRLVELWRKGRVRNEKVENRI